MNEEVKRISLSASIFIFFHVVVTLISCKLKMTCPHHMMFIDQNVLIDDITTLHVV